jgi:hypothetical protein
MGMGRETIIPAFFERTFLSRALGVPSDYFPAIPHFSFSRDRKR